MSNELTVQEVANKLDSLDFADGVVLVRKLMRDPVAAKEIMQNARIVRFCFENMSNVIALDKTFKALREQAAFEEHQDYILQQKRNGTYKVY